MVKQIFYNFLDICLWNGCILLTI